MANLGKFAEVAQPFWFAKSLIALISAPLLWIRVPHAKWGGVIAALLLATPLLLLALDEGFDLQTVLLLGASLVIAYWYATIDYDHRFE